MNTRTVVFLFLIFAGLYVWSRLSAVEDAIPVPHVPGQKPVLYLFCSSNCPPCEQQKKTFEEPMAAQKLNEYAVFILAPGSRQDLVQQYRVKSYPTLLVVDPVTPSSVLGQHEGYLDAPSLVSWLSSLPTLDVQRKKKRPRRPRIWNDDDNGQPEVLIKPNQLRGGRDV